MKEEEAREIAIRILDEFKELLAVKKIMVPSHDREGTDEEACLYGTECYVSEDALVEALMGEGDDAGRRSLQDVRIEIAPERVRKARRTRMAEAALPRELFARNLDRAQRFGVWLLLVQRG